jgi:hypothetical protein
VQAGEVRRYSALMRAESLAAGNLHMGSQNMSPTILEAFRRGKVSLIFGSVHARNSTPVSSGKITVSAA